MNGIEAACSLPDVLWAREHFLAHLVYSMDTAKECFSLNEKMHSLLTLEQGQSKVGFLQIGKGKKV